MADPQGMQDSNHKLTAFEVSTTTLNMPQPLLRLLPLPKMLFSIPFFHSHIRSPFYAQINSLTQSLDASLHYQSPSQASLPENQTRSGLERDTCPKFLSLPFPHPQFNCNSLTIGGYLLNVCLHPWTGRSMRADLVCMFCPSLCSQHLEYCLALY